MAETNFGWDEDLFIQDDLGDVMGKIYMEGEILDGDILKISIEASDMISPVLGTAFHFGYESDKLAFLKYEPGEFLERGGDPFYLVKNDEMSGKVMFGETLRRADDFPLGGGQLADFYFQVLGKEPFVLEFSEGVVSTLDTVRQDLDEIIWEDLVFNSEEDSEGLGLANNIKLDAGNFNFSDKWGVLLLMLMAVLGAMFLIIWMNKSSTHKKSRHP